MACPDPLFCFPDTPVENDPRASRPNKFKINMLEAPSKDPMWFCYGCLCFPCAQYQMRQMALGPDWPKGYTCCQAYFDCCGFRRCLSMGRGENQGIDRDCPELCLICEVCFCNGCAISATRFYVMDKYNIVPDPMDNKIIHFNNCLQCLSIVFTVASFFVDGLDNASDIIRTIAQVVFYITSGCMVSLLTSYLVWPSTNGHYRRLKCTMIGGPPGSGVAAGAPIQDEMTR